jgi:Ser/Thr protein kinase RdoA (MazF antagonist)
MLEKIISQFAIPENFIQADSFGHGLINDTYLCEFQDTNISRKYILQRINAAVFKNPEQVMKNIEVVTGHVKARLLAEGIEKPDRVTPLLVPAKNGQAWYRDDSGAYWRVFHFIEVGMVLDTVKDSKHAYEVGRGLGRFQALVADMDPSRLHDTLPGFHHTPRYLAEYDDALQADGKQRANGLAAEIDFVAKRKDLALLLMDLMDSGKIPIRVVHNDPKVNNIMIHSETQEALCMLDLDTVKPGIVHFDFGDCVRSAANPGGEEAQDLKLVGIDLTCFEAITKGYLQEAGAFLTPHEIETLVLAVKVITFELGLRFLADHLRGDTYFKIEYQNHNLHRARVQFKLLESIEASEKEMAEVVLKHAGL